MVYSEADKDQMVKELQIVYRKVSAFIQANCLEMSPIETVKFISENSDLTDRDKRLYCYTYGIIISVAMDRAGEF